MRRSRLVSRVRVNENGERIEREKKFAHSARCFFELDLTSPEIAANQLRLPALAYSAGVG
jgi:hypothetical protein